MHLFFEYIAKNRFISVQERNNIKEKHLNLFLNLEAKITDDIIDEMKEEIKRLKIDHTEFLSMIGFTGIQGLTLEELLEPLSNNYCAEELDNMVEQQEVTSKRVKNRSIGDKVVIKNPLYTNMLITPEGVQLAGKSFSIPSVPEVIGKEAIIVELGTEKFKYLCGACEELHIADTRIAFEDYTMEFYINGFFLIDA